LWGINPGELSEDEFWQAIRDYLFKEKRERDHRYLDTKRALTEVINEALGDG